MSRNLGECACGADAPRAIIFGDLIANSPALSACGHERGGDLESDVTSTGASRLSLCCNQTSSACAAKRENHQCTRRRWDIG